MRAFWLVFIRHCYNVSKSTCYNITAATAFLGHIAVLGRYGLLLQTEQHGRSVCLSVCLSVCHDREPCKNGWTDRNAVSVVDLGGLKEPCIRWGSDLRPWRENFVGKKVAGPGQARTYPAIDMLKATQQGAAPVWCGFRLQCTRWGCTLAPPVEYVWTVCVRRQYCLVSNHFDHLFFFHCCIFDTLSLYVRSMGTTLTSSRSAVVWCRSSRSLCTGDPTTPATCSLWRSDPQMCLCVSHGQPWPLSGDMLFMEVWSTDLSMCQPWTAMAS